MLTSFPLFLFAQLFHSSCEITSTSPPQQRPGSKRTLDSNRAFFSASLVAFRLLLAFVFPASPRVAALSFSSPLALLCFAFIPLPLARFLALFPISRPNLLLSLHSIVFSFLFRKISTGFISFSFSFSLLHTLRFASFLPSTGHFSFSYHLESL